MPKLISWNLCKYAIAGSVGFLFNLLIYLAIDSYLLIPYILVSALAFSLTQFVSFLIDKYWTFHSRFWLLSNKIELQFTEYIIISIAALSTNLLIFYLFVAHLNFNHILSQIISITIASGVGFLGHRWCFN